MLPVFPRIIRSLALVPAVLFLVAGCAYFNTFYNAQGLYKEGLRLKEQNQAVQSRAKFEKSIEKCALVISRWPTSRWVDDATFLVGMCYYEMGSYAKAVRHLEQLVLAFPKSGFVPKAELYRGLALLGDKQYGTAGVVLGAVRRKYPQLADIAAFHTADAFYERKEYARAVDSLAVFVEKFPRSRHVPAAVQHLAESCFRLERWAEAEEWHGRYVRSTRDPKERAAGKLKVASARLAQEKYEPAAEQVRDVIGRYADLDDEGYLLLGRALAGLGRDQEALDAWSNVRGSSEVGAESFFRIGKFHEEQKDFEKARAYYDTAKSRRANSDYGVLAVKRLSLLDAFAERDSSERSPAEALFLLAEVHNLNLGDYDEAKLLYQQVYDSFPESEWAPKGLFARAWILRYVDDDSVQLAGVLDTIIGEYPDTEYADECRRWLGLPVPERAPKVVEVPAVDTAAVSDTVRVDTLPAPKPPEELEIVELEGKLRDEARPGELPGTVVSPPGDRVRVPEPDTVAEVVTLEDEERPASEPERVELPKRPVPEEPREPTGEPVLETIHFDFDRWQIRDADVEVMTRNARMLARKPDTRIAVVGHCDPRGADSYNVWLGRKRAQAAKEFLVGQGVDGGRIEVRSEGEARPISTTPEEYWLDRRVEFLVQ